MIYLKSLAAGIAALFASFVLLMFWLGRHTPSGATVGFSPSQVVRSRALLVPGAIFAAGFAVAWLIQRRH